MPTSAYAHVPVHLQSNTNTIPCIYTWGHTDSHMYTPIHSRLLKTSTVTHTFSCNLPTYFCSYVHMHFPIHSSAGTKTLPHVKS